MSYSILNWASALWVSAKRDMIKIVATRLAGVFIVISCSCQHDAAVYDGFETPDLGEHWETRKFLPGAVQMQSSVVRTGNRAVAITLRSGDQIPKERGTNLERAELEESRSLWCVEDSAYTYSFSIFVPQDFPIVPTRLVLAQWKQYCPVDNCTPDNPILAIRYQTGELFINKQASAEKEILFRTQDDIRNKWLDFKFHIRFSRSQGGRIRAWLGDTLIIDDKGVNAYPEAGGYASRGIFYFKIGLYRDRMPEPTTIYVDEYRKEQLLEGLP